MSTPQNTDQASAPRLGHLYAHHVGMAVPDLAAAIDWYQRLFGFTVSGQFENGPFRAALIERDGFRIEIFENKTQAAPARQDLTKTLLQPGYTHLALGFADLEAAWKVLTERGAEVVAPPQTMDAIHVRFGYLRDLNGYLIEIVEDLPGSAVPKPPAVQQP